MVGPPHDDVTEVEVDGQVCLYAPGTDSVVVLNQTASDVWFLCDGQLDEQQIVDRLAASYGLPAGDIIDDVREAIRSFQEAGLMSATV